jgi:hypothetical protein
LHFSKFRVAIKIFRWKHVFSILLTGGNTLEKISLCVQKKVAFVRDDEPTEAEAAAQKAARKAARKAEKETVAAVPKRNVRKRR